MSSEESNQSDSFELEKSVQEPLGGWVEISSMGLGLRTRERTEDSLLVLIRVTCIGHRSAPFPVQSSILCAPHPLTLASVPWPAQPHRAVNVLDSRLRFGFDRVQEGPATFLGKREVTGDWLGPMRGPSLQDRPLFP